MKKNPEPGSKVTPALVYEDVSDDAERALARWDGYGGMTYSPKSGRTYNFDVPAQATALYQELVEGGSVFDPDWPICLIAITCHRSRNMDCVMKTAYNRACSFTNQPLFGTWRGEDGEYADVVIPIAFNNEEATRGMGRRYEQQTIIKLWPDGSYGYVETD